MSDALCNEFMSDDERIALVWLRAGNGQRFIDLTKTGAPSSRNEAVPEQAALLRAIAGLEEIGLIAVDPPRQSAQRVRLTLEGERTAWMTTDPRSTQDRNTKGQRT